MDTGTECESTARDPSTILSLSLSLKFYTGNRIGRAELNYVGDARADAYYNRYRYS